jgi:hypothetical protein
MWISAKVEPYQISDSEKVHGKLTIFIVELAHLFHG